MILVYAKAFFKNFKSFKPGAHEDLLLSKNYLLGSPAYMSADVEDTEYKDIYSLGAIIWQMISGYFPYQYELEKK